MLSLTLRGPGFFIQAFFILLFSHSLWASEVQSLSVHNDKIKSLQAKAEELKLWEKLQWKRLLHYEKTWFGYVSEGENKEFFSHSQGRKEPRLELLYFISASYNEPSAYEKVDQHPLCKFPARYMFLKKHIDIDSLVTINPECKLFKQFYELAKAESASLVFSSYFLDNPGSAFGHTFLRMNKARSNQLSDASLKRLELLDQGISYAANPSIQFPVLYSLGGLLGWFNGSFTLTPYYYKVREYNDYEFRDLWSYELELSPEEMDVLVKHFWELGHAEFSYYFFTENCAYHMLAALEAAAPRLNLLDRMPSVGVIPADTVVAVAKEPGFVRNVSYRPSTQTKLNYQLSSLNELQKEVFKELVEVKNLEPIKRLSDDKDRVVVLDALLAYIEYSHPEHLMIEKQTESKKWKRKVLLARAKVDLISDPLVVPTPKKQQPDLGHGSRRIGLFTGATDGQSYLKFEPRFAFHDILDYDLGYPELSNVVMGYFDLRITDNKGPSLEEFYFARVLSIGISNDFFTKSSVRFDFGYKKYIDGQCNECHGLIFEIGKGKSLKLGNNYLTLFLDLQIAQSPDFFEDEFRLGFGPRFMYVFKPSDKNRLSLEVFAKSLSVKKNYNFWQGQAEYRYNINEDRSISLKALASEYRQEAEIGYYWFY